MDPEYAKHMHEMRRKHREEQDDWDEDEDEEEQEWDVQTRSGEGYTPVLARLDTIEERVQALIRTEIQLHSKSKPPELHRAPRPITMIDAYEKMAERDEMHELAASFGFGKER